MDTRCFGLEYIVNNIKQLYDKSLVGLKKFGSGTVSSTIGMGVTFLRHLALARVMGPESFGLLTLTLAIIRLPIRIFDLGVVEAIPRFIAMGKGKNSDKFVNKVAAQSGVFLVGVALVLLVTVGLGSMLSRSLFEYKEVGYTVFLMSTFYPFILVKEWSLSILKGVGKNNVQLIVETLFLPTFVLVCTLTTWYLSESLNLVIISYGFSIILCAVLSLLYVVRRTKIKVFNIEYMRLNTIKKLISHGFPLSLSGIAGRFFRRGDILVVGYLLGDRAVGLYKTAYILPSGMKSLLRPVNSHALYFMSRLYGEDNDEKLFATYFLSVTLSILVSTPIGYILFGFSDTILLFLFTGNYSQSVPLLKILTVGFMFFIAVGPMGAYYNSIGKTWTRMILISILAISNVILNYLLIGYIGIKGAAIGTTSSFLFIFFVFNLYLYIEGNSSVYILMSIGQLMLGLISIVSSMLLLESTFGSVMSITLVVGALSLSAYLLNRTSDKLKESLDTAN